MTRSDHWFAFMRSLKILRRGGRALIPLVPNAPQRRLWASWAPKIDRGEPIRTIILKARREGVSTWTEAMLLAYMVESEYVHALVTAHEKTSALKIWGIAGRYVTTSPLLSSIGTATDAIRIGTSSLSVSTAGSPNSERGGDLSAWHASEFAYFPFPGLMTATMQALPDDPSVFSIAVIESTANGMVGTGRAFYREWQRAYTGESGWDAQFLGWQDDPANRIPGARIEGPSVEEEALRSRFGIADDQLAWRRRKIARDLKGDDDQFRQEYPSYPEESFIQSGRPFFRPHHLLPLEPSLTPGRRFMIGTDGQLHEDSKGHLEVWKWPQPGHTYLVGSDSSMGMSQDDDEGERTDGYSRSGAQILDMETQEQVAEYDAATEPHIMARHLAVIGRLYHDALLAPEVQASGGGGGREVLVYLRDQGYWNIHRWTQSPDRATPAPKILLGWETNSRSRPRMIARIREAVIEQSAVIHSRRLFQQLKTFGENDAGRMVALAGHDDLLIAWSIALMSRSENYFKLAPAPAAAQSPDWRALGIHVKQPHDRLSIETFQKERLEAAGHRVAERSFLEL